MAVKIPQDVTREDRLIGPLTLRQFLYVLLGGGIVFVAWQAFVNYYLYFHEFLIITFLAGGLTLALAFAKVNGRTFSVFLGTLYNFILSPKTLVWHKSPRAELPNLKVKATDIKDSKTEATERKSGQATTSSIETLAAILDTGGKIKAEHTGVATGSINNLNLVSPESQLGDLDVEDVLTDVD